MWCLYPDTRTLQSIVSTPASSAFPVHWIRHIGKGVDKLAPQRLLTPLVKPKFLFHQEVDEIVEEPQSPRSVEPLPFVSGSGNGFDCCLVAVGIITELEKALRCSSAASLSSRNGKGNTPTKLPTALANDEAWQRLHIVSSLLLHDYHAAHARASSASEKLSEGLLLSLTFILFNNLPKRCPGLINKNY